MQQPRKTFTLRIKEDTLKRLHFISEANMRSVNNQIENLVDQFISDYEKQNGKIPLSDD